MNSTATTAAPTSASPSASPSQSGNGMGGMGANNGQGGSSSSPLLFFVALGFGVVFTNLWIIVGVKYCFRYNQRNRALRAHADGDPIDLTVMPRPHRRRREKKLMTLEEVNAKFPLIKYKAWRMSREEDGLPAAGGISVPPSRAASVKDVDGVITRKSHESNRPGSSLSATHRPISTGSRADLKDAKTTKPADGTNDKIETLSSPTTVPPIKEEVINEKVEEQKPVQHTPPAATNISLDAATDEEDDDDEAIENAISHDPDLLGQPGDTCAICLDTLEDDDDVRGLTCGHAFHAVCVDPWLTSRRACCPLCKADYHTPKPRPEGESGTATSGSRRSNGPNSSLRMPQSPPNTWLGGRSRLLMLGASRSDGDRSRRRNNASQTQDGPAMQEQTPTTRRIVNIRWPFRRNQQNTENNNTTPTPGQLEAGAR